MFAVQFNGYEVLWNENRHTYNIFAISDDSIKDFSVKFRDHTELQTNYEKQLRKLIK